MLITKFETKSKRVKGLCFHPTKPWILVCLHTGVIQLFDFKIGLVIEKFTGHNGPVRSVDFHMSQPIFCSGGDDQKVRVWNYNEKKCLFILKGHMDYIRTVLFHHDQPWIISSSDDQTARIWNWLSRSCISILTGHTHYVMCAQFHPDENLVLTASLDHTIRVWDFTELKERVLKYQGLPGSGGDKSLLGVEIEVKHVLEGHEKGVNWASFHPTRNLICSGADDKTIKLWRMSGARAWEMDTLRGHNNNVSCAKFHQTQEILFSNSEDKSFKVWDLNRRICIDTIKKENERYWIIATHPSQAYFATGHDKGMSIYKLDRERYEACRDGNSLYFVKNKVFTSYDIHSKELSPICNIEADGIQVLLNLPKHFYMNPFNNLKGTLDFLLNYSFDSGCAVLVRTKGVDTELKALDNINSAVFVSKEKFCALTNKGLLYIYSYNGANKEIEWTNPSTPDKIFQATVGKILVKVDDQILLYDILARKVVAEQTVTGARRVYWDSNMLHVAICSNNQIYLCSKTLEVLNLVKEASKIKSGYFDDTGAFIYSTSSHIKYMYKSFNTNGCFISIENPVYLSYFKGRTAIWITREGKVELKELNVADYMFKIALKLKRIPDVIKILKSGLLVGSQIIEYLKLENCSDIALVFEKNPKVRFELCLSSGDMKKALETAAEIDERETYLTLAKHCMELGYHNISEKCYLKVKAYDKLSFMYQILGSFSKLEKMNTKVNRFNNSTIVSDVRERIKVLVESNLLSLALLTAKSHNLEDMIEPIELAIAKLDTQMCPNFLELLEKRLAKAKALHPLRPVFTSDESYTTANWPIKVLKPSFESLMEQAQPLLMEEEQYFDPEPVQDSINDLLDDEPKEEEKDALAGIEDDDVLGGLEDDDGVLDGLDDDIDDLVGDDEEVEANDEPSDIYVPPSHGEDRSKLAAMGSLVPAYHVAVGEFKSALNLLQSQIGLVNPGVLKGHFANIYASANVEIPTLPLLPSLRRLLTDESGQLPHVSINLLGVKDVFKIGFDATTAGKFQDAVSSFQSCIQMIPLLALKSEGEETEAKELVQSLVEYILAMKLEIARLGELEAKRSLELSAYMTLANLRNSHQFICLKNAVGIHSKQLYFITAAHFCRKITELEPTGIFKSRPELLEKYKKAFNVCLKKATLVDTSSLAKLDFDLVLIQSLSRVNGYIAADTLSKLADEGARCPYCGAIHSKDHEGLACIVCGLSKVGQETIGLKVFHTS